MIRQHRQILDAAFVRHANVQTQSAMRADTAVLADRDRAKNEPAILDLVAEKIVSEPTLVPSPMETRSKAPQIDVPISTFFPIFAPIAR